MEQIQIYDYINIYDIFSYEENSSIYFGNVNMLLNSNKIEECGITFDDKEVIIGEKYIKTRFNYNILGEKYTSAYGEYDVNCVIKGSNRIYYRDLDILKNACVKNQRLYFSLNNTENKFTDVNIAIKDLQYHGIQVSNKIVYSDVSNFLKKLLIILVIIVMTTIFIALWKKNKNAYNMLSAVYKASKYDLELNEFIKKDDIVGLILGLMFFCLIQLLVGASILYLTASFINLKLSYSVDFTSLKSIIDAVKSFIILIEYYTVNGFTDISYMIVKIIFTYFTAINVAITIFITTNVIHIKQNKNLAH